MEQLMSTKKRESRAVAPSDSQHQLKIPKQLHSALAKRAELEGVSLDTLALSYLSRAVGQPVSTARPKPKAIASIHRNATPHTSMAIERSSIRRQTSEMRVLNPTSIGVMVRPPAARKGKKKEEGGKKT
jgi:hypothetical protein